ncbi:hypothetical protein Tco_0324850 [Tanacetum coccineum]
MIESRHTRVERVALVWCVGLEACCSERAVSVVYTDVVSRTVIVGGRSDFHIFSGSSWSETHFVRIHTEVSVVGQLDDTSEFVLHSNSPYTQQIYTCQSGEMMETQDNEEYVVRWYYTDRVEESILILSEKKRCRLVQTCMIWGWSTHDEISTSVSDEYLDDMLAGEYNCELQGVHKRWNRYGSGISRVLHTHRIWYKRRLGDNSSTHRIYVIVSKWSLRSLEIGWSEVMFSFLGIVCVIGEEMQILRGDLIRVIHTLGVVGILEHLMCDASDTLGGMSVTEIAREELVERVTVGSAVSTTTQDVSLE